MRSCCVCKCRTKNLHRFPKNEALKNVWLSKLNLKNVPSESFVCSQHFDKNDYITEGYSTGIPVTRKILRRGSVPKILKNKPEQCLESSTSKENRNLCSTFIPEYANNINEITFVDVKQISVKEPKSFEKDNSNILIKQDYCRLCANLFPTEDLLPIFLESGYTSYGDMLELCLPGKIKENDKYSHGICSSCTDKLENCCTILISFIEADNNIRNIFNNRDSSILSRTCTNDMLKNYISKRVDNIDNSLDEKSLFKIETEDGLCLNSNNEVFNASNKFTDNIKRPLFNEKTPFSGLNGTKTIEQEDKHEIKFQCLNCLKLFNNEKEVTDHSFVYHSCKENNEKVFRIVKAMLKKPKRNKLVNNENKNINPATSTENLLPVNKKIVIFEYKFQCIKCSELFKEKIDLLEHTIETHPTASQYNIFCKIMKRKLMHNNEKQPDEQLTFVKYERILIQRFNSRINEFKEMHPYARPTNEESAVSIETFQIKYQCQACSLLFISYKEVLNHAEHLHPTFNESSTVALVVKVKDSKKTNEINPLNEENEVTYSLVKNQIICINDGTIFEIDPNVHPERERIKYSDPKIKMERKYKCMKCARLFPSKKKLTQHFLSYHQSQSWNEMSFKIVTVKRLNYRRPLRKTYECLICCSNHITKYGLIQHTRFFHSSISKDKYLYRFIDPQIKQPRECLRCSAVLHYYNRYLEHMQKHISFVCENCGNKFDNIHDLRDHMQIYKKPKLMKEAYKCIDCDEPFTSKIKLHKLTHKISKEVSCLKCNKTFFSELELKKHERVHELRVCDVCGKSFDVKYLKNHLQTHNTNTPYKCNICFKGFKSQSLASAHKKYHNAVKNIVCQICGKLIQQRTLRIHMLIHTGKKSQVCDICGVAFRRKFHLQTHKKTHMQDRGYKCPICNIYLCNIRFYWNHMTVMHGAEKPEIDTPFTCDICQKHFTQKDYLDDHYQKHTGKRHFSCKVCYKTFPNKIYLHRHKTTHMDYNQLLYTCDICDKNFKRNEHLQNHRRNHSGEKPFSCPTCQKLFRGRAEMIKHTRIHKRQDESQTKKNYSKDAVVANHFVNDSENNSIEYDSNSSS